MKYLSGGVPDSGSLINLLLSSNSALDISVETVVLFFLSVEFDGSWMVLSIGRLDIWLANAWRNILIIKLQ